MITQAGEPVILKSAADTPRHPYLADSYAYKRRATREVMVGKVGVGGSNPIRVQSMTTTPTQDVEATLLQTVRLVEAGCEIVRITTPGSADARALGEVKRRLLAMGLDVPLVADIHFNPSAAMEAALYADKVRINPGNFADEKRFKVREYSELEYEAELRRIEEKFRPIVLRCRERGVSMRVGTNHGSLSDRIMNRFGDTPEGMVESAIEFAAICRKYDYHELIFSMKASNPKVMIAAYRLLVARLDALGWNYPLHLGVTEAGNAEDGRIKSAIGIGSLLDDGLGDTVRVSLTEEPEEEIPVAFALVKPYNDLLGMNVEQKESKAEALPDTRNPYHYTPRLTYEVASGVVKVGGMQLVGVVAPLDLMPDVDAFAAVADLAKRKGQNAIRPDFICVPLSNLRDISPLADELRRRSEEEDPAAGKSALALIVEAGLDLKGATAVVPQLTGVGGVGVQFDVDDIPDYWEDYEACVRAAVSAHVPLWLQATNARPTRIQWQEVVEGTAGFPEVDLLLEMARRAHALGHRGLVLSLNALDAAPSYLVRAYRLLSTRLTELGRKYPIHLVGKAGDFGLPGESNANRDTVLIGPSVKLGSLLCDGIGNSIEIAGEGTADERVALAFNILQAAGSRTVKAEFVACPSCGRTLFDLQETTERIKVSTGHLRGVKIAIMGCIVNGLGELADADFGYMGGAPGKVNLFVGKECVEKGVPTQEAVDRLINLIKSHGKWVEPTSQKLEIRD